MEHLPKMYGGGGAKLDRLIKSSVIGQYVDSDNIEGIIQRLKDLRDGNLDKKRAVGRDIEKYLRGALDNNDVRVYHFLLDSRMTDTFLFKVRNAFIYALAKFAKESILQALYDEGLIPKTDSGWQETLAEFGGTEGCIELLKRANADAEQASASEE